MMEMNADAMNCCQTFDNVCLKECPPICCTKKQTPYIQNGLFIEKDVFRAGHSQCINVKEILFQERSLYQDVLVFSTEKHGNVLVLDGALQCSEADEFVYQEMITLLPVNSHPKPSSVLVIGGGDGGVLRELDRHPLVKEVVCVEIDKMVIEASKRFLKGMAVGFDSPKATVVIEDAFEYLKNSKSKFDVIIADLTDPEGPSQNLYTPESLSLMGDRLNDNGILCLQSECFWHSLPLISNLFAYSQKMFPVCKYASAYTPLYPFGQIGFLLCSKSKDISFDKPVYTMQEQFSQLKYYSPEIHQASFVLPKFVKNALHPI